MTSRKYWSAREDVMILLFKRGPGAKLIFLLYCIPSAMLSLGRTVGKAGGGRYMWPVLKHPQALFSSTGTGSSTPLFL